MLETPFFEFLFPAIFAALLTYFGIKGINKRLAMKKHGKEITATVVGFNERETIRNGRTWLAHHALLQYEVNGHMRQIEAPWGNVNHRTQPHYQIGDEVKVVYDERNPNVYLIGDDKRFFWKIVILIFALILWGVAFSPFIN